MGKAKNPDPPNYKKYGVPLYGAAWAPSTIINDAPQPLDQKQEADEVSGEGSTPSPAAPTYLVFCGGGGEGRSGIPNALLLAEFDFASNSLSDMPVFKLGIGADLPYRMAVHPGGEGLICSLPKSCKWFQWDEIKTEEVHKQGLKLSEKVLTHLEDVGQQLALTFNNDGSMLAVGGEDGNLRVFKWPSMENVLSEAQAHATVKDFDFSPDGKFLVSLGSGGPGRVWDLTSSTAIASLPKENDEVFAFCRFSQTNVKNQVLYIAAVRGEYSVLDDVLFIFRRNGTIQGDIVIVNSASMQVQAVVRKAHLGIVTTMRFSQDSRALVSASMDSSARVTVIKEMKKNGFSLWIIIFIIIVAIAAYLMKTKGIVP
uniref:Uncharacterized protein n=1 Tax=Vitis vinifera TaxID=29760 RepID=A5BL08_VITVI|nr:hypothetical protein VITISV_036876 [Vitis vinifera]